MAKYTVYTTKGNIHLEAYNLKDIKTQVKNAKLGKILQITSHDDIIGELK